LNIKCNNVIYSEGGPNSVTTIPTQIAPDVLRWARESAGATIEEAAKWADVETSRYIAWEEPGEQHPTLAKLRTLADRLKRPLAMFFLPEPPVEKKTPRDFRKAFIASAPLSRPFNTQFRQALERRELTLELLQELEEEAPEFTLRATINDDPTVVAKKARDALGISIQEQIKWSYGGIAFNSWRAALEKLGVLVFQFRDVPREEMRGVSVPEFPLPLIIVNRKEGQNARVFSLFHELTHLMLREGGLCDMSEDNSRTEVFCNRVAGEFLVPSTELLSTQSVTEHDGSISWSDSELHALARLFKVSEEVILRRLLLLNLTDTAFYAKKRAEYVKRKPGKGGPISQDVDALSKLGWKYADVVLRSYSEGHITFTDAASYMGVRGKYLSDIQARVYGG
jgi:Zn-dependent peptidase ImmA (M78 family)